jgi:hypothetical protein
VGCKSSLSLGDSPLTLGGKSSLSSIIRVVIESGQGYRVSHVHTYAVLTGVTTVANEIGAYFGGHSI